MSPDSKTEQCGSGTRPTEWEPDNTADVMIDMCMDYITTSMAPLCSSVLK